MRTMKALVYEKPGRSNGSIRNVPYPSCGERQIVIRVLSCGICKPAETSHDHNGSALGTYPCIPGHEFAGVIEEVGDRVAGYKVGDRVTADNGVPCSRCFYCQMGKPAYCLDFGSLGHNISGGMAQYVVVNESATYHIPDSISTNAACLCELIGCCLNCIDRAGITFGQSVVVLGAGSSGLILAQLAKSVGAGSVVALDVVQSKLDLAKKLGLMPVKVERDDFSKHEGLVKELFPYGADVILDTTGDAVLVMRSIELLKKGGVFVNYSFPTTLKRMVEIDMAKFILNELTYVGSTFGTYRFQKALTALKEGMLDVESIITGEFPLDNYFEALDTNITDPNSIKVIIHPTHN